VPARGAAWRPGVAARDLAVDEYKRQLREQRATRITDRRQRARQRRRIAEDQVLRATIEAGQLPRV
jgi:hypothetical protein